MEGVIVLVIIAWLIPKLINAVKKAGKSGKQAQSASRPAAAPRQTPSVQMNRPAPAMKRQTPGVAHSAHRDFSAPDAPCIVCEQTPGALPSWTTGSRSALSTGTNTG